MGGRKATGEEEDLLSERGSDRFELEFRKEEGNWKIIRVKVPEMTFE